MDFGDIEHILWDWNGTLLDDLHLTVHVTNEILAPHGGEPIDVDYHRGNFIFPVSEYYRHLGFPPERIDHSSIHAAWNSHYEARKLECSLHDHVPTVLESLGSGGFRHAIISAYPETLLRTTVAHFGIAHHFRGIYGNPSNDGTSKLASARRLFHELEIDAASAVIVGDTHHDAEIAAAVGCRAILVSHGHHTHERLTPLQHPVCRSVLEVHELLTRARNSAE